MGKLLWDIRIWEVDTSDEHQVKAKTWILSLLFQPSWPCPPTRKPVSVCLVLGVQRLTWFGLHYGINWVLSKPNSFPLEPPERLRKNLIPLEGLGLGKEEQVSQTINIYFLNHLTFLLMQLMGTPVYETLSGRDSLALVLNWTGAQALRSVTLGSLSATKLAVCGGFTQSGHF